MIDVDALLAMPLEHAWGAAQAPGAGIAPHLATLPPADAGIVAALGPWDAHEGRKWHVCGAIGGIMRKLGFKRDACEAVIREWLADAPRSVDVRAGVVHALGAWAKPAETVSGYGSLADLVGDEHAAIVSDAAAAARFPGRHVRRTATPAAALEPDAEPDDPDADTFAPAGADDAPSMPVFVMTPKGRDIWHYDPHTNAYRECARESLHVALSTSGAETLVQTQQNGKRLTPQTILDNGPTLFVRGAVTDFSRSTEAEWDPSVDGGRMLLGVRCPAIEPREDPGVAAWLSALAGGAMPALAEWIASTRQDAIHRIATALCLIGPHSSGKTLLAVACARLWGSTPVALEHVAAQFNATMARCPIVFDDECATIAKRKISTEDFRVLIQNRERDYEPKGKERRTLIGAQRFILAANDISALKFSNAIGVGAADAIAERLTIIQIAQDDTRPKEALEAMRLENGEIDLARLDGHLQWIRENTALPSGHTRFLGALVDRGAARAAVVASVIADNEAVFEYLRGVLEGTQSGGKAAFVARGSVWVRCEAFAEALVVAAPAERWDARRLRGALGAFRGASVAVRLGNEVVRAWELDAYRLTEALGADVGAVVATLSRPDVAPQGAGKFAGLRGR